MKTMPESNKKIQQNHQALSKTAAKTRTGPEPNFGGAKLSGRRTLEPPQIQNFNGHLINSANQNVFNQKRSSPMNASPRNLNNYSVASSLREKKNL